ncbi:MAG: DUF4405 domain-containing protein [Clostridia bacterium]|nr:DUF4405 domain-containing protein [Clostridia bacterium]
MKKLRMTIDIAMTIVLIALMAYSLIGTLTHEILGITMFALFTVHHILNRKWFGALSKGKYRSFRIFQTVLVFLLIGSVLASAISGIILSEHAFTFLPIRKGASVARSVHMVCAYANYILMSLHIGLHWNVMRSAMQKGKDGKKTTGWVLRAGAIAIAAYGVYAFIRRQIGEYLFLRTHFLFLDPSEPIVFFFLDYMAIMGLFVFCGHYLGKVLKWLDTGHGNFNQRD